MGSAELGTLRRVHDITNSKCPVHHITALPAHLQDPAILFACSPTFSSVLTISKAGVIRYVECSPVIEDWEGVKLYGSSRQGRFRAVRCSQTGDCAMAINSLGEVVIMNFAFAPA